MLDEEARGPASLASITFGWLREPMLRIAQWGRTFKLQSRCGTWKAAFGAWDPRSDIGQYPLDPPSVFGFFRPGYVPPGTQVAQTGATTPEQVFFVSMDGHDVHDGMSARQPALLRNLSLALGAFDTALGELGRRDKVTTFTVPDFGRTLSTNGDGTDHGWGGHRFVLGGAVKGRAFYGQPARLSPGQTDAPEDPRHVAQGRLLPSTSVDQFAATLARWFGASDDEMHAVLPNPKNFGDRGGRPDRPVNLGFLQCAVMCGAGPSTGLDAGTFDDVSPNTLLLRNTGAGLFRRATTTDCAAAGKTFGHGSGKARSL